MKKLFLIDGIGAIVSAVMLGVVLIRFNQYIGVPTSTLYSLAAFPCVFAAYDFYCYWNSAIKPGVALKAIGLANLAYCVLSTSALAYHISSIKTLGWLYFGAEIVVVSFLGAVEIWKSNQNKPALQNE